MFANFASRADGSEFVTGFDRQLDGSAALAGGFAEVLESAPSITMATPVEIEGTLCDVVAISAKAGSDPVLWYFGREDNLPRRCEIVLPDNELISGSIRVDFAGGVAGEGRLQLKMRLNPRSYVTDIVTVDTCLLVDISSDSPENVPDPALACTCVSDDHTVASDELTPTREPTDVSTIPNPLPNTDTDVEAVDGRFVNTLLLNP